MSLIKLFLILFITFTATCERLPILPGLKTKEHFDSNIAKPDENDLVFISQQVQKKEEELKKLPKSDLVNEQEEIFETDSKENILKAFGNPDDDTPVTAQDTAPKPYKAMLAALNLGDKELAFEYAKQYVRYKKNVLSTVTEAVRAENYAKYSEGELTNTERLLKEDFDENYLLLAKKDIEERKNNESKALSIEDEAKDLLNKNQQNKITPEVKNELIDREVAKNNILNVMQPVASNKLDFIFFFKPGEEDSQKMARNLEIIFKKYKGKVNLVGMTTKQSSELEIGDFKEINRITYEVGSGAKLASELKVQTTPTLLIMSDKKQTYLEQGLRSEFYIDEIIKIFGVGQ